MNSSVSIYPKNILVYCGSRPDLAKPFQVEAEKIGMAIAQAGSRVIYGGAATGLMGLMANAALANSGEVIGVMPKFLTGKETAHQQLSKLILTNTMAERKQKMLAMADAVIVLPGGLGTLEELLEAISIKSLGLFQKPIMLLNTNGYYETLLEVFRHSVEHGFMDKNQINLFQIFDTSELLLKNLFSAAKKTRSNQLDSTQ